MKTNAHRISRFHRQDFSFFGTNFHTVDPGGTNFKASDWGGYKDGEKTQIFD